MRKDRLTELRVRRNLTQEELSELAGIGSRQVWRYENGETVPNADVIASLARALGVSSDYLLGLSDVHNAPTESDLTDREAEAIRAWRDGDYKKAILAIVGE